MTDNADLARRMVAWRIKCDLTLDEVADAAGITKQAVLHIENGKNSISVAKLHLICRDAFDTTLYTFFGPLPKGRAA